MHQRLQKLVDTYGAEEAALRLGVREKTLKEALRSPTNKISMYRIVRAERGVR